jgi:hypothetical protein
MKPNTRRSNGLVFDEMESWLRLSSILHISQSCAGIVNGIGAAL